MEVLRRAYEAFNARDIEAALELMHGDVDWPNGMEGGRVAGRDLGAVNPPVLSSPAGESPIGVRRNRVRRRSSGR